MAVLNTLDTETAADTLEEAEPRVQRELVASLRRDRLAELFHTMTPLPRFPTSWRSSGQWTRRPCVRYQVGVLGEDFLIQIQEACFNDRSDGIRVNLTEGMIAGHIRRDTVDMER